MDIQRLAGGEDLPLPAYETAQAAGMDLRAAVPENAPVTLGPGERAAIPTGLAIGLPGGYEAQVRPRSGLALKHGLSMVNSPGTIDADYRGEIKVLLINHGTEPFTVNRGERIAQLVVAPVTRAVWAEVESLGSTERSDLGSPGSGSMLSMLTCIQSRPASLKPSTSSGVSLKALVMMVAKLTPPLVALMRATNRTRSGWSSGSPPSRSNVKAPSSPALTQ